ncbi:MAG: hypothetical protein R2716_12780 [Microthrixaceae bacterium]
MFEATGGFDEELRPPAATLVLPGGAVCEHCVYDGTVVGAPRVGQPSQDNPLADVLGSKALGAPARRR